MATKNVTRCEVLVDGEPWTEAQGASVVDAVLNHVLGGEWGEAGTVVECRVRPLADDDTAEEAIVRVRVLDVDRHGHAVGVEEVRS